MAGGAVDTLRGRALPAAVALVGGGEAVCLARAVLCNSLWRQPTASATTIATDTTTTVTVATTGAASAASTAASTSTKRNVPRVSGRTLEGRPN